MSYKEMLDAQIEANRNLQLYGNMTQTEKKLNQEDLKAYKTLEPNQYAMIPGMQSIKQTKMY